jgi:hypothetical protein
LGGTQCWVPMTYLFRLTASSRKPGLFDFEEGQHDFRMSDGTVASVSARNADKLCNATSFHFEAGGFDSEASARLAAEHFRLSLRIVNAVLGIGINIPLGNTISAQVSEAIKEKLRIEQDAVAVDSVWGISILPEDGRHFEYVMTGNVTVKPADPEYILSALQTIWPLKVSFDSASETALYILGLASAEGSDKATFLASYLALEPLIQRKKRSAETIALIKRMQKNVEMAAKRKRKPLDSKQAESLLGGLKALHEESFSSALMRFAGAVTKPTHIRKIPTKKFFSACIKARNKLAHNADPSHESPLQELSAGIREFVTALIWNRNNLPPFTVNIPPSAVSIPKGGLSIRVM